MEKMGNVICDGICIGVQEINQTLSKKFQANRDL